MYHRSLKSFVGSALLMDPLDRDRQGYGTLVDLGEINCILLCMRAQANHPHAGPVLYSALKSLTIDIIW